MRSRNTLPKKVAIVLFTSAYAYTFFVVSVVVREATSGTRRMLPAASFDEFSLPTTNEIHVITPRAFEPTTMPCFLESHQTTWWQPSQTKAPTNQGFFFLKIHKTGSSTGAGVHLRIARNVAARLPHTNMTNPMCRSQFDHSTAQKMNYSTRSQQDSFLWTIVREPTERAISQFFHFEVSRRTTEPTVENFKRYLTSRRSRVDGFYLRALSVDSTNSTLYVGPKQVQSILNDYNFIAILERIDESMVALQMILGLPTADILFLNKAKVNGGYDAGGYGRVCTHIESKNVTPGMVNFLMSQQWKERVRWDKLLYEAVNQSLDMTIDRLGRDRFERNLRNFQQAQQIAKSRCFENSFDVRFPCSADREGLPPLKPKETGCLWKDSGCGMTCLDKVADELGLWVVNESSPLVDLQ